MDYNKYLQLRYGSNYLNADESERKRMKSDSVKELMEIFNIKQPSVWVWTKKLPCDTPIDFRNCNDYYRNLYDEKTYEEYIESILNEIKSNIDNILSTGLPLDISTIDID